METPTITKDDLLTGFEDVLKRHITPVSQETVEMNNLAEWANGIESLPGQDKIIDVGPDGYEIKPRTDVVLDQWKAEMKAAVFGPVERTLNPMVPGIQIGSIVVGGATGLLVGELVDGFMPPGSANDINFQNVALKAAAAFGLVSFGSRLMSKQAVFAGTAVLGVQVLSDVLPLDDWIRTIVDKVRGVTGQRQNVLSQAEQVALAAQRRANQRQPHLIATHDKIGSVFC